MDPHSITHKIDQVCMLRQLYLRRALSDNPIHFRQFPLLTYVKEHEGCTQNDLANHFHVSPAAVATSTKRMQKSGLLTKKADEENLRCNRLWVTEDGKAALSAHISVFHEIDETMLSGFSDREVCTLFSMLQRMGENIAAATDQKESNFHELVTQMRKIMTESEEEPYV